MGVRVVVAPQRGMEVMTRTVALALCVFTVGLLMGVVFTHGHARDWNPAKPLVAGVRWLDAERDLGAVWVTNELPIRLDIVNDSRSETFEVGPIWGTCSCTHVEPQHLELAPGAQAVVEAVTNLEGADARLPAARVFDERVTAVVTDSSGSVQSLRAIVRGSLRTSYTWAPTALDFGTVVAGTLATQSVHVTCHSTDSPLGLEVLSAPEGFTAEVESSEGERGAFRIVVRTESDIRAGRRDGCLRFRARLAEGPFVTRTIPVHATAVDEVEALPSTVFLAPHGRMARASQTVHLVSRNATPFRIADVDSSGSPVQASFGLGSEGDGQRVVVSVDEAPESTIRADVRVRLEIEGEKDRTLEIPVVVQGSVESRGGTRP